MLRKHTYDEELEQSKRLLKQTNGKKVENQEAGNALALSLPDREESEDAEGKTGEKTSELAGKTSSTKEFLFEKVVTPSDVGKLNRLVIPKQYAERYFPLDPNAQSASQTLSFEDESGKHWRFR